MPGRQGAVLVRNVRVRRLYVIIGPF